MFIKGLLRTMVRGPQAGFSDNEAGHLRLAIHTLRVLLIHPRVANVGGRHGDDLAGVGGIREHLLVAGHASCKNDLARGGAFRTPGETLEDRAVCQG